MTESVRFTQLPCENGMCLEIATLNVPRSEGSGAAHDGA